MGKTPHTLLNPVRRSTAVFAVLLSLGLRNVPASEPFAFDPPSFLGAPAVARAASGNTWQFEGGAAHPEARLLITVAEVPEGMSADDTLTCAEAFLQQIRRRRQDAFWQLETPSLRLGSQEVSAWRWAGSFDDNPATGLVACIAIDGRFLAVAFEDSIAGAPQTFPAIRRALRTLDTRTP